MNWMRAQSLDGSGRENCAGAADSTTETELYFKNQLRPEASPATGEEYGSACEK